MIFTEDLKELNNESITKMANVMQPFGRVSYWLTIRELLRCEELTQKELQEKTNTKNVSRNVNLLERQGIIFSTWVYDDNKNKYKKYRIANLQKLEEHLNATKQYIFNYKINFE